MVFWFLVPWNLTQRNMFQKNILSYSVAFEGVVGECAPSLHWGHQAPGLPTAQQPNRAASLPLGMLLMQCLLHVTSHCESSVQHVQPLIFFFFTKLLCEMACGQCYEGRDQSSPWAHSELHHESDARRTGLWWCGGMSWPGNGGQSWGRYSADMVLDTSGGWGASVRRQRGGT